MIKRKNLKVILKVFFIAKKYWEINMRLLNIRYIKIKFCSGSEWNINSRRKINNVKCSTVEEELILIFLKDAVEYQIDMSFRFSWIHLKE